MKSMIGAVAVLQFTFFVFMLWLGAVCVNYDLFHIVHKTIPFLWAFILNVVTAGIPIPVAIVIKVLTLLGVIS